MSQFLFDAAMQNDYAMVSVFLNRGADANMDVHFVDEFWRLSAIEVALLYGHEESLNLLS
jgi:hypothetical protein